MNVSKLIGTIYQELLQFVPLFRIVWIGSVVLGGALLILAFVLKRNPQRVKSPWAVGGIGLLMVISSGAQLITSLV